MIRLLVGGRIKIESAVVNLNLTNINFKLTHYLQDN